MIIKTEKDLTKLRHIGQIVGTCLEHMLAKIEVGMSTKDLDDLGRIFLEKKGAQSAPIVMYNFPGTTCISLNEEAAHGIPKKNKIIQAGDLVNIDVSAVYDGLYADSGASVGVDPVSPSIQKLMKTTKKTLFKAINKARAGENLNIIGRTIEKEAQRSGYTVIRNLCSHGIGHSLHENPDRIVSYKDPGEKRCLEKNMVITIEPFLSTGTHYVSDGNDGWTLLNDKGHFSAQYEHTMVIQEKKPPLLITQVES